MSEKTTPATYPDAQDGKRLVLMLWTKPGEEEIVENILTIVRSGLTSSYVADSPQRVFEWLGPFELPPLDWSIFEAFGFEHDGVDEGKESDREPHIVKARAIRDACRQLTRALGPLHS